MKGKAGQRGSEGEREGSEAAREREGTQGRAARERAKEKGSQVLTAAAFSLRSWH